MYSIYVCNILNLWKELGMNFNQIIFSNSALNFFKTFENENENNIQFHYFPNVSILSTKMRGWCDYFGEYQLKDVTNFKIFN